MLAGAYARHKNRVAAHSNLVSTAKQDRKTSAPHTCQAAQAGSAARFCAGSAGPQQARVVLEDHIASFDWDRRRKATASTFELLHRNHSWGGGGC